MAEKGHNLIGAAGRVPLADQPAKIRNVVLVGHCGAGKTTLTEALLIATGAIPRAGRVEDGTTVTDFEDAELRQQRSVGLAIAPIMHDDIKINLLDAPGFNDFVGDLRAGLRAADAALFVMSAADGIDGATQALWQECASVGMPRAVVITKLDSPRADYHAVVASCRDIFGSGVMPLSLPLREASDGSITSLLGLISREVAEYRDGRRTVRDATAAELATAESARDSLLEGIIAESEDETLMGRYLGGEAIDAKVVVDDLEKAVARGSFFPVLCACGLNGFGMAELLEVLAHAFPSPLEHPLPVVTGIDGSRRPPISCDPVGPLLAEVIKTTTDPYVGRISLVRVFSGTLRPDTPVHVSGHGMIDRGHEDHDIDMRVGTLSSPLGKTQRAITACVAGDICAIAKLARAETSDTLSDKGNPLLMSAWDMPEPLLPVAMRAQSKADDDKLSQGLARLAAEDPTLRLEMNAETHQLILWCMGEAHADVLLDRLQVKYGVNVEIVPMRVPMRETFTSKISAQGRHVKQSGGHGQFGVCDIEIEPLPEGGGFEFVDKVVGGSVPRQFISSVEKGLRAQMERGVVAGYPLVDIRVTLLDGKSHAVDSSDMAFQMAGALALKEAAKTGQVALLEPVDAVEVIIADEYVGAVMSDLSGRRGRVSGTEPADSGRTLIRAEVPQVEVVRYAVELRSLSHGTGIFSRRPLRYEPMPAQLAAKAMADQDD